jgi:hypothetical protein
MKNRTSSFAIVLWAMQADVALAFQTISNFGNNNHRLKSNDVLVPGRSSPNPNVSFSPLSLNMKVTINIDVDLPEFNIPEFILSNPTDNMSLQQILDSQSDSVTSLISSLSLPPMMDTTNLNYNMADFNSLLSIQTTPDTQSILNSILENLLPSHPPLVTTTSIVIAILSSLWMLSFPPNDFRDNHEPFERGQYDPIKAREYYAKHPLLVIRRTLQLLRIANKWILRWLFERHLPYYLGGTRRDDDNNNRYEKDREKERAQELLSVIQQIGPTAIKIGQALSVRPDLISEVYTSTLSELQDNVPPFDSNEAKEVLVKELGEERFQSLISSPSSSSLFESTFDLDHPVASASIGQVYKGFIKRKNKESGTLEEVEVAIKVQRPNVLSEIALDLFIVREIAPFYQEFTMNDTNLQNMADEWGRGFIAELTYKQEAENTMRFNEEMKKRNLNAVCAPEVIDELSTDRVLTTKWVNGVRLDRSGEDDVARLCGVALNAYLVMLLEIGTLHCGEYFHDLITSTLTENYFFVFLSPITNLISILYCLCVCADPHPGVSSNV